MREDLTCTCRSPAQPQWSTKSGTSADDPVWLQGERHALVYATGKDTFFGRAAALVGAAKQQANLQKVIDGLGACCADCF